MRLIAFLNSYTEGISGGDVHFIEVAKRLRDFDKVVVTSLLGEKICKEEGLRANYLITTKERHSENLFRSIFFTYFKRVFKALTLKVKILDKDILYSTSDFLPDILPAFVLKLRNKNAKWVAFIHLIAPNPFYGYRQVYLNNKKMKIPRFKDILYKLSQLISIYLMKRQADIVSVDNSEMKKYLIGKGIESDRIFIHENGIDLSSIRKVNKLDIIHYDAIFIGAYRPQKGIPDLIDIWEKVCKKRKNSKLAIIGDIPLKKEVQERKMETNISLLGTKIGQEKIALLKSSTFFIFPSFYESFGNVVLEAIACGLPVIAYDLPVYREIYPKGMVRVSIGSIEEFAKKALELLENQGLFNKLSKDAKEVASKHDWERATEKELKILEQLLK